MEAKLLPYLLESSICLIVLYLFYRLLLHKETCFTANRLFIGAALAFSLIIPLVDIPLTPQALPMQTITLQELWLPPVNVAEDSRKLSAQEIGLGIYTLVTGLLFVHLGYRLLRLIAFARRFPSVQYPAYRLVLTQGKLPTFSFFRLLFWNTEQVLSLHEQEQIRAHELVHIRQWHSLDVLLMEILCILFWFNPVIYLWKKSLQEVHEYLADAAIAHQGYNRQDYIRLLVKQTLRQANLSLTSSFNHLPIQKRIAMIQKMKIAKPAFWKFALSVPVVTILVLMYACEDNALTETGSTQTVLNNSLTEVEQMPKPAGDLYQEIANTLSYPTVAREKGIEGKVIVEFVVNTEGHVTDAKVLKGIGYGCDEEALAAVRATKWIPGRQEGQAVDVKMTIPIAFSLQENKSTAKGDVLSVVEEQPAPVGGFETFYRYIASNLQYPASARENNIEGRVFAQFIVNEDGSISDVQILRGIGYGCDDEVVRILTHAPKWNPGKHQGKPARVQMSVPIAFKL